jgi:hypothetical protein
MQRNNHKQASLLDLMEVEGPHLTTIVLRTHSASQRSSVVAARELE